MFQNLKTSTVILIAALLSGYAAAEPIHDCAALDPDTHHAFATLPAGFTLETIPAEFETETRTIVIQPEWVEYIRTPPEMGWVEGEIEGYWVDYIPSDVNVRTRLETYVIKEATTRLITFRADDNESLAAPTHVIECIIPAVTQEIATYRTFFGRVVERAIPYEISDGRTYMPITKGKTEERVYPAITQDIEVQKVVKPTSAILRNDKGEILENLKPYINQPLEQE